MTIIEVGTYLQAQGIGTLNTDLFYGSLPDTPIACVSIEEMPGQPPQWALDGVAWERPRMRFVIRAATYADGREQAEAVYRALLEITNETLSGTRYLRADPSTPAALDRDEHGRQLFAVNCLFEKALSSLS